MNVNKKLDSSRPYAEVMGILGAAFEQDGAYYSHSGDAVQAIEEYDDSEPLKAERDDTPIFPAEVTIGQKEEKTYYLSTAILKAMLEQYGEKYESRAQAVAFIDRKRNGQTSIVGK